eukprot:gene4680-852_t
MPDEPDPPKPPSQPPGPSTELPQADNQGPSVEFGIASSAFSDGGNIPQDCTCEGSNANVLPGLTLSGVPADTKSVALLISEGGTEETWSAYNIRPSQPLSAAAGTHLPNSPAYRGPCPATGSRTQYTYTAYALSTPSVGFEGSSGVALRQALERDNLASASLSGYYQKGMWAPGAGV